MVDTQRPFIYIIGMIYKSVRITEEYHQRLLNLSHAEKRSMAKTLEVLIDTASDLKWPTIVLKAPKHKALKDE